MDSRTRLEWTSPLQQLSLSAEIPRVTRRSDTVMNRDGLLQCRSVDPQCVLAPSVFSTLPSVYLPAEVCSDT